MGVVVLAFETLVVAERFVLREPMDSTATVSLQRLLRCSPDQLLLIQSALQRSLCGRLPSDERGGYPSHGEVQSLSRVDLHGAKPQ